MEVPPIHFNYGRSSMGGGTKEYIIDPKRFDFSFGFPLQDDRSTGEVSMLYGLDKRVSEKDVETDLGVARHMVRQGELPQGRNVPLRTLIAQLLENIPDIEIYSDDWHLGEDVNIAIGAYMYTMLTNDCALAKQTEPTDTTSPEWRTWMSHKIGYTTAWTLMHMDGVNPCYNPKTASVEQAKIAEGPVVYPNPSNGDFTIDMGKIMNKTFLSITDLLGRVLLTKVFTNRQLLNFSLQEPAGVYVLTIESKHTNSIIRIIKE